MISTNRNSLFKQYVDGGFALVPLKGKVPVDTGWNATPYKPELRPEDISGNFGAVLKDTDLILDVDPRNFREGDAPLKRLAEKLGVDFSKAAVVVKTGGGGFHLYFKKPADKTVRGQLEDYPGLEFKTRGQQVVAAGSIHPDTGEPYKLIHGRVDRILDAPKELLDLITRAKIGTEQKGLIEYDDSDANASRFVSFLESAPVAVQGQHGDRTTYTIACKAKSFGLSFERAFELMLDFYNPRCQPPWTDSELETKIRNAYSYAQNAAGAENPKSDFDEQKTPVKIRWDVAENGQKKKTLNNAVNYFLLEDSALAGILAYNEFTDQTVFVKRAPWHEEKLNFPAGGKPWQDEDTILCRHFLSEKYKFDLPSKTIDEAATVVSYMNTVHPVREYLSNLKWDGKKRLDTWLTCYLGAETNPYTRTIGVKTLLGAVARIYQPDVKFDYMLVLEGKQGIGKSTVVKILGGLWYGDIILDPHSPDTIDAMRGLWIVECAEMEMVRRADVQALRAFLSRQVDRTRLAYGRRTKNFSRQCIFIGTMNPDAEGYLRDMAGNRRFWPVNVNKIDMQSLQAERDQLWAEAVQRFMQGDSLYIDDADIAEQARLEQDQRRPQDPWLEKIKTWLESDEAGKNIHVVTGLQIWTQCLLGREHQFTRREQCRISNVLQFELLWEKGSFYDRQSNRSVSGYRRPGTGAGIEI